MPGFGLVVAVLEQCLADTLGNAAMGLAVHDHRVDGALDIVDRRIADDLDRTGLGIDLDFAALRAVWKTRDWQGLVGYRGQKWRVRFG